MRSASYVLAALCWLLCGLAFVAVLVVVFKPRATDADMIPAKALYAASVVAGGLSLISGLVAWIRKPSRDLVQLAGPLAAAIGLLIPAIIIWRVMK